MKNGVIKYIKNKAMDGKSHVRKINVIEMIQTLVALNREGVEYVDLIGEQHEEEGDDLVFGFTKEYMHPDYASNFDKMFPDAPTQEDSQQKNVKLTDSDLNQLL